MTPAELCKCGHPDDDHDAGECWAEVTDAGVRHQCECAWQEPATVAGAR